MSRVVFMLVVGGLLGVANTCVAQYLPYYTGGWGSYPSSYEMNRKAAQQDRNAARQQTMAMDMAAAKSAEQTLTTQAEARTRYLVGQQESSRDWWFSQQQRQMEQRQAMAASRPSGMPAAGSSPFLPSSIRNATPPPAQPPQSPSAAAPQRSSGPIQWPTLLLDPRFAQERAAMERLFLARTPEDSGVDSKNYEAVLTTAEEMKQTLRQMASELNAAEYQMVNDFLVSLVEQAKAKVPAQ